jgi:drug/metabolite transporter (DMT)-like permease
VGVIVISAATSLAVWGVTRAPLPPPVSIAWCLASGALEAAYFATLARALSRAPLGPVYTTIRGGSLVVVWPVSLLFLGERVSVGTAAGTLLVLLGLAATGFGERPRVSASPPDAEGTLARRLGWAAICAGFVGAYQMAYKVALVTGGQPGAIVALSLGSAAVFSLVVLGRPRAQKAIAALVEQPLRIVVAGVLSSLGFAVFLVAMGRAGAGSVVTLRNTSILFAQLVAVTMGDRPTRLGWIGAALVTGGGALLARG